MIADSTYHLHLISDSTGETVNAVARACLVQFEGVAVTEHLWSLVRTRGQLEKVIAAVQATPGPVIFTPGSAGNSSTDWPPALKSRSRLAPPARGGVDWAATQT